MATKMWTGLPLPKGYKATSPEGSTLHLAISKADGELRSILQYYGRVESARDVRGIVSVLPTISMMNWANAARALEDAVKQARRYPAKDALAELKRAASAIWKLQKAENAASKRANKDWMKYQKLVAPLSNEIKRVMVTLRAVDMKIS